MGLYIRQYTMQRCCKCKHLKEEADFEVYKNIRRKTCNSCKEKRIGLHCDHGRERSKCIECDGGSICIHQKRRSRCKECDGGSICIHQRVRTACKECDGVSICIHKRQRSACKECDGGSICKHQKRRSRCKECDGGSICIHQRVRTACKECSPQMVIIKLIRQQVRRCFNISTLQKINHSIEYLGCDVDTLKLHIQSKMTADMTWENIHYDHIKPVSCFDLDDEDEFLKCCHFTNLQPLLAADNMRLNNTWTEENEVFWHEHILYHPEFKTLYKV